MKDGIAKRKCESREGCNLRATHYVIDLRTGKRYHACIAHALKVATRNFKEKFLTKRVLF